MNSVPLADILPWGFENPPTGGRTVLICDSSETDGRFLLHTIASQCLSSKSSKKESFNIIWINCGMKTDGQIRAAMKKIGSDIRSNEELVDIVPVIPHLSQQHAGESDLLSDQDYLKKVYRQVKSKTLTMSKYMIIIDNCSSLSTYFGATLTYTFVQKMRTLIRKQSNEKDAGLVILASHDLDQEHYIHSTNQEQRSVAGNKKLQYIGAGGRGMLHDSETMAGLELDAGYELDEMVWERALVELADGIVDVVPLASGFAKDVHGRLVFTSRLGGGLGWKKEDKASQAKNNFSTTLVNYCCSDAGIRAIRLRVGS